MKQSIVLLLGIYLCSCHNRPHFKSGLEGKSIPQFNLLLIDSTSYLDTRSIAGGKPTVFFYFSPSCPYCKAQMKNIIDHEKTLNNIQFVLVTAAPYSDLKRFYKHYELNKYSNITVGVDQGFSFARYFKTTQVPYLAVYDKDRKLKQVSLGRLYSSEIKNIAFD